MGLKDKLEDEFDPIIGVESEMLIESKLAQLIKSAFYILYVPFSRNPNRFVHAGYVQQGLFPHSALRNFKLHLKHSEEKNQDSWYSYLQISNIYKRFGKHEKAFEALRESCKLCITVLIDEIACALIERNESKAHSLVNSIYGGYKAFFEYAISKKEEIKSEPWGGPFLNELTLRDLLKLYNRDNPREASQVLERVKTEFPTIHPEDSTFASYNLKDYKQKLKEQVEGEIRRVFWVF